MKKIGILSDTHGFFYPKIPDAFSQCDEIWHCGDFGSMEVASKLNTIAPLEGVYGNIDGQDIRSKYPEKLNFKCEGVKVFLIHNGGYPGHYSKNILSEIKENKPDIFVCGHSHILKIMPDKQNDLLHINPGASGKQGIHQVITFIRLTLDDKKIKDLEIIEHPR